MRDGSNAKQTTDSFAQKWTHSEGFQVGADPIDSDTLSWILGRNGFNSLEGLTRFLADKTSILDAGCGNGRILNLLASCADVHSRLLGVDIAAAHIAGRNLANHPNVSTTTHDLLEPLGDDERFDFIYCQEVLHHTGDPKRAFSNLCRALAPDGLIAIYVYKRKGPVREFSDDFIHDRIKGLSYDEAEPLMSALRDLGRALSNLDAEVEVPEIALLEIPAGRYDVQRLIYNFFLKCYWNPELSDDANTMINFDWYHPSFSSRHTEDEVLGWFRDEGLRVVRVHVDAYGITVHGRR